MKLFTVPYATSIIGGIVGVSFMLNSPEHFVGGLGGIALTLSLVNALLRIEIHKRNEPK